MAIILYTSIPPLTNTSSSNKLNLTHLNFPTLVSFSSSRYRQFTPLLAAYRFTTRGGGGFLDEDEDDDDQESFNDDSSRSFEEAVKLFNNGEYYECHDVLEALWNKSQEPVRTLVHGILQCAVGFHHLFNQNHRGAMMELGEGLCKLRKLDFDTGPFHDFEQQISAVLNFIYQTQLELAACTDELCVTMDQSERSYQLLGGYGAGQRLYRLENDENQNAYILFCPNDLRSNSQQHRIKFPVLRASEEQLTALE